MDICMRFQHLLSGGSFRTDTPISVSVLNLTVIFLRREQIPSCVFLSSYYQGKSTIEEKKGCARTHVVDFPRGTMAI